MTQKRTYETFPLVIEGQTLDEAKAVLIKGLERRVHVGPVWVDKGLQDQDWEAAHPSPGHSVDANRITWATYRHGGVNHLQAFYSWSSICTCWRLRPDSSHEKGCDLSTHPTGGQS